MAVEFSGVAQDAAPLAPLPKAITEISGRLSLVPLAFRTRRDMSVALYAVDFGDGAVVPYRTTGVIGDGAFSFVYRIDPVEGGGPPLALKAYNRLDTDTGGRYIALERELAGLGLPMVPAMTVCSTNIHHCDLVMAFSPNTLRSIISKAPPQPPETVLGIMRALFAIQQRLIARGVVHTDASVNNVLCVPAGGGAMELVLADYGGAHRISGELLGCCTFGLPEHNYRPFAAIPTPAQATAAARYLAAAIAAAVHMRKRPGPLYEALTHRGSTRVDEAARDAQHRRLRAILERDGLGEVSRWLDPDPDKRSAAAPRPTQTP